MVYWTDRRTYVAVVANDATFRQRMKARLAEVADEVATFPDDQALLPELDRLTAAEHTGQCRYQRILVVEGNLGETDHGLTIARWARPYFDKVVVLGARKRHWVDAMRACHADSVVAQRRPYAACGQVARLAAQA